MYTIRRIKDGQIFASIPNWKDCWETFRVVMLGEVDYAIYDESGRMVV